MTANEIGGAFTATAATSAVSATFALTNLKGNTTTTMTSSKNPAVAGEAVIFTVTVTSSSGTPAGTVDYFERLSLGAQADAAPSLVNGVVTFTVPSLALGTHNLQALYSGDAGYEASASPVFTQVVNPLPLYPLTVNTTGSGSGTVISLPAGLACSLSCTANFTAGTVVTLTATANTGSTFTGWSGAVLTTTNPLVLTLDASKVLTATFSTYRVYLPVVQRP